jgi:uncharacterized protein YndB with AHSA1/START domain
MIDATDYGTYVEYNGRPAVCFVRTYPHPIENVWRAITESDQLRHWFPCEIAVEQRTGGTVTFEFGETMEPATGRVLVCEPPRRLGYTWGGDELHYELESLDGGRCRLTFVNVLHETNTAARSAAGWTVCLAELDRTLSGQPGDGPHGKLALEWQPIYEAYIAAGLPSGAPIPNIERR